MIPQAAPMLRFARYAAAVDGAIRDVLNGEALIIGPNVAAFEAAFAADGAPLSRIGSVAAGVPGITVR